MPYDIGIYCRRLQIITNSPSIIDQSNSITESRFYFDFNKDKINELLKSLFAIGFVLDNIARILSVNFEGKYQVIPEMCIIVMMIYDVVYCCFVIYHGILINCENFELELHNYKNSGSIPRNACVACET